MYGRHKIGVIVILLLFFSITADAQSIIGFGSDAECRDQIIRALNDLTHGVADINTKLEIIRTRQDERSLEVTRIWERIRVHEKEILQLEKDVAEIQTSWGMYMSFGGVWGVVGALGAIFGFKKFTGKMPF